MCKICVDCFSDKNIQEIIKGNGKTDNCDCCGKKNVFVADEEDLSNEIARYCQLYIAYHFDEPDYNPHSGGNIHELVESKKLFIDPEKIKDTSCYTFLDLIFSEDFGYLYSEFNWSHAIKSSFDHHFLKSFESTFSLKDQMIKISEWYEKIKDCLDRGNKGKILYRARIGCKKEKGKLNEPYSGSEIGAPPPAFCSEAGRANRPYVSFLYLAEDEETAITEIRATKGDLVSVGKFSLQDDLNIFNLAFPNLVQCSKKDDAYSVLESIASLNNIYSCSTGSSEKSIYLPTQLFVEKLVQEGYDGICFRSSFNGKLNYVIFDPRKAAFIPKSSKLFHVNAVKIDFDPLYKF